jgi:hypothetical protein
MTSISIMSFASTAATLKGALIAMDKQAAKTSATIAVAFNAYLDAVRGTDLSKDQKGVEALMTEVRECEAMQDMVAVGLVSRGTVVMYAQGLGRAFFHGEAWFPRAYQSEDKGGLPALPWSKGATAKPATAKADKPATDKGENKEQKASAPADAAEARALIAKQLEMIHAYARKYAKVLDLTTRDVCEQVGRLADTVNKVEVN